MAEPVAELISVSKRFGATQALDDVSLSIEAGEIVALLGPNGAGKSTAINLLMGLRRPTSGKARLFGRDPTDPVARQNIGVTPQELALPEGIKVAEVIDFVRSHFKSPRPTKSLLADFGLTDLRDRQVGGLSGGQKRRLSVALAYAPAAPVVFLDEPTTGLDAPSRRALWDQARLHAKDGGTLLLTTHYLEEAEALANRVILIDHGKIIREGTIDEIKASVDQRILRFRAPSCPDLPGTTRTESDHKTQPPSFTLYCHDADAAVRALVEAGTPFEGLEVLPVSLEEAINLTLDAGTGPVSGRREVSSQGEAS